MEIDGCVCVCSVCVCVLIRSFEAAGPWPDGWRNPSEMALAFLSLRQLLLNDSRISLGSLALSSKKPRSPLVLCRDMFGDLRCFCASSKDVIHGLGLGL